MLVPEFENAAIDFFSGAILASDPAVIRERDGYRIVYTDYDADLGQTIVASVFTDGTSWRDIKPLVTAASGLAANFESPEIVSVGARTFVFSSGYASGTALPGFPASLYGFELTAAGAVALSGRPLLAPTPGWYDNDAIYSPTVVEVGGQYVMYYVGHSYFDSSLIEAPGIYLLAATSSDGIEWTKRQQPIFVPGDGPDWARDGIAEPDLLIGDDGTVHLFFTALRGDERVIGYASASDPFGPFVFAPEPILTPDMIGGGTAQVLAPTVLLEGGVLSLWCLAHGSDGTFRIAHAEAPFAAPPAQGGTGTPAAPVKAPPLVLTGTLQSDDLAGAAGDDQLNGEGGDDRLLGNGGHDTLTGGTGIDLLSGGAGQDVLLGGAGGDRLAGSGGRDTLIGEAGKDVLNGGRGDDRLVGGEGNDRMDGGAGVDVYVLEGAFGRDRIAAFDTAVDLLVFDGSAAGLVAREVDGHLVLALGVDTVTLVGLGLTDLDAILS